jgi:phosphatidylglycerophosphatase A
MGLCLQSGKGAKLKGCKKLPVSANKFFRPLLKNIATLGFVGYLPVAPGTWGTLAGLLLVGFLSMSATAHLFLMIVVTGIGIVSSGVAEQMIGETDSGHIIIDEVAGFLVSVLLVPHTYGYLIAGFLLFRIFDILKPFPIRKLERTLKGGAGIMADDILAGVFTNIILQAWIRIF